MYDILCLALLGMAFSSLCFADVLSTLMLRRLFVHRLPLTPLRGRLRVVFNSYLGMWPGLDNRVSLGSRRSGESIDAGADCAAFLLALFASFFWGRVSLALLLLGKRCACAPRTLRNLRRSWKALYPAKVTPLEKIRRLWKHGRKKGPVKNSPGCRKKAFSGCSSSWRAQLPRDPARSYYNPLGVVTETRALPQRQIDCTAFYS